MNAIICSVHNVIYLSGDGRPKIKFFVHSSSFSEWKIWKKHRIRKNLRFAAIRHQWTTSFYLANFDLSFASKFMYRRIITNNEKKLHLMRLRIRTRGLRIAACLPLIELNNYNFPKLRQKNQIMLKLLLKIGTYSKINNIYIFTCPKKSILLD